MRRIAISSGFPEELIIYKIQVATKNTIIGIIRPNAKTQKICLIIFIPMYALCQKRTFVSSHLTNFCGFFVASTSILHQTK